jgi:trk system potassium uptake protein TrkA
MSKKRQELLHSGAMVNDEGSMVEIIVPEHSQLVGKTIMSLGLDQESIVMLLHRDDATIIPTGRTKIHGGDVLVLLAPDAEFSRLRKLVESKRK